MRKNILGESLLEHPSDFCVATTTTIGINDSGNKVSDGMK